MHLNLVTIRLVLHILILILSGLHPMAHVSFPLYLEWLSLHKPLLILNDHVFNVNSTVISLGSHHFLPTCSHQTWKICNRTFTTLCCFNLPSSLPHSRQRVGPELAYSISSFYHSPWPAQCLMETCSTKTKGFSSPTNLDLSGCVTY